MLSRLFGSYARATRVARLTKFAPQSLLFDRRLFTPAEAERWVHEHASKGFVVTKAPEVGKTLIRIRQFDPRLAIAGTKWATVTFGKGVKAVFAHVRVADLQRAIGMRAARRAA